MCDIACVSPRIHHQAGVGRYNSLNFGSWNVEGLTDIKIYDICKYMRDNNIHIMCIQEARKKLSDTLTAHGYTIYLSGSSTSSREWAGVGFILSPRASKYVIGFTPFSNRIASLRLRVAGGCCAVLSSAICTTELERFAREI